MDLLELMRKRRSIRTYTEEKIPDEKIDLILKAGLLSASGRGIRPWEFIVVRDKDTLKAMTSCRTGAAAMLEGADCAIVVIGDASKTDVWVEDCSIAMANMHLMADSLGIGSCWIQGRLREAATEEKADNETTESYLKKLLGFPSQYCLEAILSLGMPAVQPEARKLEELPMDKVHWEKFNRQQQ